MKRRLSRGMLSQRPPGPPEDGQRTSGWDEQRNPSKVGALPLRTTSSERQAAVAAGLRLYNPRRPFSALGTADPDLSGESLPLAFWLYGRYPPTGTPLLIPLQEQAVLDPVCSR
jgi:transposase InsO family protein